MDLYHATLAVGYLVVALCGDRSVVRLADRESGSCSRSMRALTSRGLPDEAATEDAVIGWQSVVLVVDRLNHVGLLQAFKQVHEL
jgi:hypothetical protein